MNILLTPGYESERGQGLRNSKKQKTSSWCFNCISKKNGDWKYFLYGEKPEESSGKNYNKK